MTPIYHILKPSEHFIVWSFPSICSFFITFYRILFLLPLFSSSNLFDNFLQTLVSNFVEIRSLISKLERGRTYHMGRKCIGSRLEYWKITTCTLQMAGTSPHYLSLPVPYYNVNNVFPSLKQINNGACRFAHRITTSYSLCTKNNYYSGISWFFLRHCRPAK